jgi:hypothetical protein
MRRALAWLAVLLVLGACAGEAGSRVTGTLIQFDGTLESVESFTVLVDGDRLVFTPDDGLTFHGGPLSHLFEHVRSGSPVEVGYEERDGSMVAVSVDDA